MEAWPAFLAFYAGLWTIQVGEGLGGGWWGLGGGTAYTCVDPTAPSPPREPATCHVTTTHTLLPLAPTHLVHTHTCRSHLFSPFPCLQNFVRPARFALAIAMAPMFDRLIDWIGTKARVNKQVRAAWPCPSILG